MSTMYSRVKIGGHPLHPMLIAFPVTFYTTTLVGFLIYAATGNLFWWRVGLWSNVAGVVMAVVAAIPGFVDWSTGIPKASAARKTGRTHMALNLTALACFVLNVIAQRHRWPDDILASGLAPNPTSAVGLSVLGFVLTLGAGWFGWTLVQTHHVGVDLTDEQRRYEPRPSTSRRPSRPLTSS